MPSDKTTILKQVLRDEGLPALAKQAPYFSTGAVAAWLRRRRLACPPTTLNRYLHEFRRAGLIYDAGRGWYSSLATPFTLDREPVSSLVQELQRAFPLVEFSCWSTEQVKGAMHHLLSRFVTVINVEADSMQSVCEHLRDGGWDAWLNPRGAEAARFAVRDRTVVVRRESRKSPSKGPFASIEKLLVELCFEARDLQLMAMPEFHTMLTNLAGSRRIQIATLSNYASERKLPLAELLGKGSQLTPPF